MQRPIDSRLVIAICTFRRPNQLAKLLILLKKQVETQSEFCRILVVDNDPDKSALPIFEAALEGSAAGLSYLSEPRTGVGNARNAALGFIGADESILFFDDDQTPNIRWLSVFLQARENWPDTVLTGAVRPLLPKNAPLWTEGAWAWGAREGVHGEILRMAGFGNLLIPQSVLSRYQPRIPESFTSGSGEDTVVTLDLHSRGVPIRFVEGADAVEPVPFDRLTKRWVFDRCQTEALAWAKTTDFLDMPKGRLWLSAAKAAFLSVTNIVFGVICRSEKRIVRGQSLFARVVGYAKYAIRARGKKWTKSRGGS